MCGQCWFPCENQMNQKKTHPTQSSNLSKNMSHNHEVLYSLSDKLLHCCGLYLIYTDNLGNLLALVLHK